MYDRVFQEFNGSHMAEHQQQAPQQQPLKNGFNNSTVMATSNNGKSKYVSPPMSATNLNDIREQQLLTGHTEMDEIDRLEAELMANSFPNNSNNVMGDAGAEWQSQVQQQQV